MTKVLPTVFPPSASPARVIKFRRQNSIHFAVLSSVDRNFIGPADDRKNWCDHAPRSEFFRQKFYYADRWRWWRELIISSAMPPPRRHPANSVSVSVAAVEYERTYVRAPSHQPMPMDDSGIYLPCALGTFQLKLWFGWYLPHAWVHPFVCDVRFFDRKWMVFKNSETSAI